MRGSGGDKLADLRSDMSSGIAAASLDSREVLVLQVAKALPFSSRLRRRAALSAAHDGELGLVQKKVKTSRELVLSLFQQQAERTAGDIESRYSQYTVVAQNVHQLYKK